MKVKIPSSAMRLFAMTIVSLFSSTAQAEQFHEWEQKNLAAMRGLVPTAKGKPTPFSEASFLNAQPIAREQLLAPGFEILEIKTRLGICQLMSWYSTEILQEARRGQMSLDQVLSQVLRTARHEPHAPFTIDTLKTNLLHLGLLDEGAIASLSNTKANQLYNLFEAWVTFRAINRLVDGKDPESYFSQQEKSSRNIQAPYKITRYDELSKILFTTKMRDNHIVLAYHDGIPSQKNVMSFNTVSHVMLMTYNHDLNKWEISTRDEHIVRGGDGGFKVKRKKNIDTPDTFIFTQDPDDVADEADIKAIVFPEHGRDYTVVHMANIFPLDKGFEESFLEALGLDKVSFEGMFLRTAKPEEIPGTLSIFHFNAVKEFNLDFFKALETYRTPNEAGISLQMGASDPFSYRQKNHPISIQIHRHNPWYGDLSDTPGISISHALDGKRLALRLFADREWNGGDNYKPSSAFYRKTRLSFKDCPLAYGTARPASIEDWRQFVDMFKTYLNTDIAPLVQTFLNRIGFTAENRDMWFARGDGFIQNGITFTNRTYDTHLIPSNEKEIERTNNQIPRLSAVRKTQLHSGLIVPSKITPNEASADSLFRLVGLTRKQYINTIVSLMRNPSTDPYLVNLIEIAMEELNIKSIEEWELTFDNPHLWTTYTHMRIIAELYGLQIFLYELDRAVDESADESMFIPLKTDVPSNRVIGRGPDEMHVAVVNEHFIKKNRCHHTWQFEEIHLTKGAERDEGIRDGFPDQIPLFIANNRTQTDNLPANLEPIPQTDVQALLSDLLWGLTSGTSTK